jgi:hypothetical protein
MKPTATLLLTNSIAGWLLMPHPDHADHDPDPWLDDMHGQDWKTMSLKERAFLSGQPIADAIAHIRSVCRQLEMTMSVCGGGHTLRLWRNPPEPVPTKISVDLRWGAWSFSQGHWDQFEPGVWQQMLAAFSGQSPPLVVRTSPTKEIRYGEVTITKGGARGWFADGWDEPTSLADTLGIDCDDAFSDMLPMARMIESPGVERFFRFERCRSFARLMCRIDAEELHVISTSKVAWQQIEGTFVATKPA